MTKGLCLVSGFFLTKIFHPNVAKNGAICVNTLKRDWKPDHGIKHILLVRGRGESFFLWSINSLLSLDREVPPHLPKP